MRRELVNQSRARKPKQLTASNPYNLPLLPARNETPDSRIIHSQANPARPIELSIALECKLPEPRIEFRRQVITRHRANLEH